MKIRRNISLFLLLILMCIVLGCSPPYEFYVHPKSAILTSCNGRMITGFSVNSQDYKFCFKIVCKNKRTEIDLRKIDTTEFHIRSFKHGKGPVENFQFKPNIPYFINVDGAGDRDDYEIEFMFDENLQLKYVYNDTRKCWD